MFLKRGPTEHCHLLLTWHWCLQMCSSKAWMCFSFKFHLNNNNKILKALDIHNQREKRLGTQQVSHFSKITKLKILYTHLVRKDCSSNSQWDDRLHRKQQSLLWSCERNHYFKGSSEGEEADEARGHLADKKICRRTNKMLLLSSQNHTQVTHLLSSQNHTP